MSAEFVLQFAMHLDTIYSWVCWDDVVASSGGNQVSRTEAMETSVPDLPSQQLRSIGQSYCNLLGDFPKPILDASRFV
jgi:hypothetical protein